MSQSNYIKINYCTCMCIIRPMCDFFVGMCMCVCASMRMCLYILAGLCIFVNVYIYYYLIAARNIRIFI